MHTHLNALIMIDSHRWQILCKHGKQHITAYLLGIMAIIGLAVYTHYGVSADEQVEAEMVQWHLQMIGDRQPWQEIPGDLEYYGLFFNAISVLPYFLGQILQNPGHSLEQIWFEGLLDGSLFTAKHLSTFLFSLLAYGAVARVTQDLLGKSFAVGGVILLALMPRFWGHSFFNPKDIPFAALFIVVSYVGACFTATLLNADRHPRRKRLGLAGLFGLVAGLLTCVRVGGFVVILFAVLVQVILQVVNRPHSLLTDGRRSLLPYGLVVLVWAGVTVLLSPVAWGAPLQWFAEAVFYLSNHAWEGVTLTFGQNWPRQPPWYYLPVWLGITTPLLTLGLAIGGWVVLWQRFFRGRLNEQQQAIILWLNLQFWVLPLVAILRHSTIYNGLRQFLFVLPALAVFAIAGLASLLQFLPNHRWRLGLISTCVVIYSAVAWEMIQLHPYEYVYFNSLVRQPQLERNFETDYWSLSTREAMEWINQQPGENKQVYYVAPGHSVLPFANPDIAVERDRPDTPFADLPKPFYYLAYPRNKHGKLPHPLDFYPQCDPVFQVQRPLGQHPISLSIVKLCP